MSINKIINRKFYLITGIIILAELFSLSGFLVPEFGKFSFFIFVLLFLILSLIKLEYGVLILLAELFIGSKGYLFAFEFGESNISIRIALWLIVMSVWFAKVFCKSIKSKKIKIKFLKNKLFPFFLIFLIFLCWGLVSGYLNKNSFNDIFFDFNGYLFLLLIFPFFEIFNKNNLNNLYQIFLASILWLSLKTLFLLFIFSHNILGVVEELYRWVRVTGVGEITQMQGGFYRIFFQSHIFVLIGFFILLIFLIYKKFDYKNYFYIALFSLTACLLSINLITFSRSNWVGLITGLFLLILGLIIKRDWQKILKAFFLVMFTGVIGIALIAVIVKFPYPSPTGGFNTAGLISERASKITNESGVSSRWTLLPVLTQKIIESPILGQGFGTTVTYKSSDPRILETTVTGDYTTFAFEWGWLDIWLKIGFLGLLSYILFIYKIFINNINEIFSKDFNIINIGIMIGIVILIIVSFFSPYTNHPLGIGFLLISAIILQINNEKIIQY